MWLKDSEQFLTTDEAATDSITLSDLSAENSGVYTVETVVTGVSKASNAVTLNVQCKWNIHSVEQNGIIFPIF